MHTYTYIHIYICIYIFILYMHCILCINTLYLYTLYTSKAGGSGGKVEERCSRLVQFQIQFVF